MKQILFLLAAVLLLGGCAEEKKTDVRWATFNIRYDNPQDSLNNWQYRKDRVCQFIKDHELDIVGMQEGDKAIIFGDDLPVTVLSEILETIPYEILTSVSNRVKRVYYQN